MSLESNRTEESVLDLQISQLDKFVSGCAQDPERFLSPGVAGRESRRFIRGRVTDIQIGGIMEGVDVDSAVDRIRGNCKAAEYRLNTPLQERLRNNFPTEATRLIGQGLRGMKHGFIERTYAMIDRAINAAFSLF